MKNNKKAMINAVRVLLVAATVAVCFVFSEQVIYFASQLAVISAKSFMPQETVNIRVKAQADEEKQQAKEKNEEYAENTTGETTEEITEEKSTATQSTRPVFKSSAKLTDTDRDIKKLIKDYEGKEFEKGGSLVDRTYKNEGVTDTVGEVRIKNTNKTQVDFKALMNEKADLCVNKKEPSVLIFHTHTTETYQIDERGYYAADFAPRSESEEVNMVRVGKAICEQLEKAGYKVIHDTEIHDGTYTGAYAHSRKSAEAYLEKYPSIQVALDIHRDAIQLKDGTKIRPVATVNGKKAAQIMIISGCQEEGNGITNLPDWKYNLTFALLLQKKLEDNFQGITRPLYFCARSYNMNLTHCSLLVEMGSDANTLEQAVYSGKCLGAALAELLDEHCV